MIQVEVVYALPERQELIALTVEESCTAFEAARRSGIEQRFPGLLLEQMAMGIFGRIVDDPRRELLHQGNRVEIYRPLQMDPKQARRVRAAVRQRR